jgi:peptidoglycan/xylan/chitin deacetylase (PgdA/CDA1 family)
MMKRVAVSAITLVLMVGTQVDPAKSQNVEYSTTPDRLDQCTGNIALTFDDGPDPELTPQVLDILDAYGVRATFFVVGSKIDGNEHIIKRMVDEGHSVQNHTWDHPYLTELANDEIEQQIQETSAAIERAGAPSPMYLRPPYGDYDPQVVRLVEDQGLAFVTWTNDLDIRDWDGPASSEEIISRVQENAQDGGVVLLHDVLPNTVEAIPGIINAVRHENYCIKPYDGQEQWTTDA